jgi:acetylornithine aminotransferase
LDIQPKERTYQYPMLTPFYQRFDSEFIRGQGVWLWDDQDRRYFDAINGVGSNLLGHCEPELVKVAQQQVSDLWQVSNQLREVERDRLARRLCHITGMDQVFFHATGSEAMDLALKISLWNRPGTIATVDRAFHGTSLITTMITQWPGTYETLQKRFIDPIHISADTNVDDIDFENISAVLIEPVLGMGGGRALEESWLVDIYHRAKQAGCIIVADECQCGFYRCGGPSVMKELGLDPDILILSKGLANGLPLSACLFKDNFVLGRHGTTYGGTALSCAVANRVLDILPTINLNRARRAVKVHLSDLSDLSTVEAMRFNGHMVAIDLKNLTAEQAWRSCYEHGVLVTRSLGDSIRLMLPLNTSEEELEYLYQHMKEALS